MDAYPNTLSKAYDMLVNYVDPTRPHTYRTEESGLSFLQHEGGPTINPSGHFAGQRNSGRGESGRGRGNRSRGRGQHGGRGTSDNSNPVDHPQETDSNPQAGGPNPSNSVTAYSTCPIDNDNSTQSCRAELLLQQDGRIPATWLLADSCSSIDIISSPSLLHDIRNADSPLDLYCNAGKVTLHQVGYLGDYPFPVWFHPTGLANVMSLNNLTKCYRITMDSNIDDSLQLHKADGEIFHFYPSGNGLYHHPLPNLQAGAKMWSMVATVADQAHRFTCRDQLAAQRAREMQNIIMRPGDAEMISSAIHHLRHCPVTPADVRNATSRARLSIDLPLMSRRGPTASHLISWPDIVMLPLPLTSCLSTRSLFSSLSPDTFVL